MLTQFEIRAAPVTPRISLYRFRNWVFAIAGLAILVARTFYVSLYAGSISFWDQWDADILLLFKPLLDHRFTVAALFASHNEHRIFFTRLLSIALWRANRNVFDNRIECYANILLVLAIFGMFAALLRTRTTSPAAKLVAPCLLAVICCLPLDWENFLIGFQSSFYFMILMTLGTFGMLTRRRFTWREWIPACVLAFASLFTMAAGLFTAAIACALALWRSRKVLPDRPPWPALPFALVTFFGIAVQAHPLSGAVVPALAWRQHAYTFMQALAWPAHQSNGPLFLLAWLPLIFSIRGSRERLASCPGRAFILALAGWSLLIAGAIACSRGATAPRYSMVLAFGVLANAVLAFELAYRPSHRWKRVVASLFALYVGVSLVSRIGHNAREMQDRHAYSQIETQRSILYVRHRDPAALLAPTRLQIPYYLAPGLEAMLRDPEVLGMSAPPLNPDNSDAPLTRVASYLHNSVRRIAGLDADQWTPSPLLAIPPQTRDVVLGRCAVDFINDRPAPAIGSLSRREPLMLTGWAHSKTHGSPPEQVIVQLRGDRSFALSAVNGLIHFGYVVVAANAPPPGRYTLFVAMQSDGDVQTCNTNKQIVVQ